eukprot:206125_1
MGEPVPPTQGRPKKALSSYFIYAKELRQETDEKLSTKDISKRWKNVSDDEKAEYKEKSKKLKEQEEDQWTEYVESKQYKKYLKKMEEWKADKEEVQTKRKSKNSNKKKKKTRKR